MRSSYKKEDVTMLLKDITGLVKPQPTEERERLIQSGRHYSEMLPVEYVPTQRYMEVYKEALRNFAQPTALAVGRVSDKIIQARGKEVVLVSLARAGIPIGILIKHFIRQKYQLEVPHYAISIIKGRGIDDNAMNYLLKQYQPRQLLFVDGWIGKGAILDELRQAVEAYEGVSPELAVAADPANVTALCGTHEDILIPSSCLNCTVSGLVSRTVLREDIIGPNDFHGAVYYGELADADLSYEFLDAIEQWFPRDAQGKVQQSKTEHSKTAYSKAAQLPSDQLQTEKQQASAATSGYGIDEVRTLAEVFGVSELQLIKPGIGETTRVLLRRVPWKVLIDARYRNNPELGHIVRLAEEKQVPIEFYPLRHYKCCGIIKKLAEA
ncbi:MAG: cysteine protease StiP family protein [Lachnospiraceae bacterium]|nr:cysteine protease StiP family protein [Lachnospiraceae bacterium]